MATADLITLSKLLTRCDWLATLYERVQRAYGSADDSVVATLSAECLSSASTASLTPPASGTWEDLLGAGQGVYSIGAERTRVRFVSGNDLTFETRGIDGTLAATHALGATVYLPSTLCALARRLQIELVGDGTDTNHGLGAAAYAVIYDLGKTDWDSVVAHGWETVLGQFAAPYCTMLDSHIAQRAPAILTGTPSWVTGTQTFTVGDLSSFLRYYNDPDTGTAFSALVSYRLAYLYWLATRRAVYGSCVFPDQTTLLTITAAGGAFSVAENAHLERYSSDLNGVLTQGYCGQLLRARCTTAATSGPASVDLVLNCQGMDSTGEYVGRARTATVQVVSVAVDDTLVIGGVTFTGVLAVEDKNLSGATNASPIVIQTTEALGYISGRVTVSGVLGNVGANGEWDVLNVDSTHWELVGSRGTGTYTSGGTLHLWPADCRQFEVGATAAATASNLARAINRAAIDYPTLLGGVVATVSDDTITLTPNGTSTTNYLIVAADVAQFSCSAGLEADQARVTFGGGGLDGTSADTDSTLLAFTGTLSLAAGQSCDVLATIGTDRCHRIVSWTLTPTGTADGAVFVVETVPDRLIG